VTPGKAGIRTYVLKLLEHLARIDRKNSYFIFADKAAKDLFLPLIQHKNFVLVTLPISGANRYWKRLICEQLVLPLYVLKHNIDLLFSPANIAAFLCWSKQVLVVHDLKHKRKPVSSEIPAVKKLYYNIALPLSVKRVDKIIAVSNATREDLLKYTKVPEEKIRVILEGVDVEGKKGNTKPPKAKPFILFVGMLYKHKNADKVLQAFAKVKSRIPHSLIIVGKDPPSQPGEITRLKELAEKLGVASDVHFTGWIPDSELQALYLSADLFVYPSAAEGFGLPILEAMACGVPVIGSNCTSIPEVIGNAGIIVNPDDIDELADAILRILTDQNLRKQLIQRGYERAKAFTWERTAKETLEVFEEVYRRKGCIRSGK